MFGQFAGNYGLNRPSAVFPAPFADFASTHMPTTMKDVLLASRYIVNSNGLIREAIRTLLAYFVTEPQFQAIGSNNLLQSTQREKYEDYASRVMDYQTVLQEIGLDALGEGNCFLSVIGPFRRQVHCKKCGHSTLVREFIRKPGKYKFQWTFPDFRGTCPLCGWRGAWRRTETRLADQSKILIKRWSTSEMQIRHAPNSKRKTIIWEIPPDYRLSVRRGDPQFLEDEPWELIEAAGRGHDFEFDPEEIMHFGEPTGSGVKSGGWFIPKIFINFRQIWFWTMLHRMVEAVGVDYMWPVRMVSPAPQGNADLEGGDNILAPNLTGARDRLERAIKQRHHDPAQWVFNDFPVEYNLLGGDATRLVPFELIEQATADMLNSFGFPIEIWKGSMTTQAALPGIRMFISRNSYVSHMLGRALDWVLMKVADIMNWEPVTTTLKPPTMIDDIQTTMAILQLMQGGYVAPTDALAPLGIKYRGQVTQTADDAEYKQKVEQQQQRRATNREIVDALNAPPAPPPEEGGQPQSQPQGAAQGGMDPSAAAAAQAGTMVPPSSGTKVTLDEMSAVAEQEANRIAFAPPTQRRMELNKLRQQSPEIHALVMQKLEQLDNQLKQQGKMMLMQQAQAQAGAV